MTTPKLGVELAYFWFPNSLNSLGVSSFRTDGPMWTPGAIDPALYSQSPGWLNNFFFTKRMKSIIKYIVKQLTKKDKLLPSDVIVFGNGFDTPLIGMSLVLNLISLPRCVAEYDSLLPNCQRTLMLGCF